MLKLFATDVLISKGYEGAPALNYSDKGDSVRFRIGKRVYDTRTENNTRWINLTVKAFGPVCERIKKMQLKEGSVVNLVGRFDEDSWDDKNTGEHKTASVIILDEIEYASSPAKSKNGQNGTGQATSSNGSNNAAPATTPNSAPTQQTGFGDMPDGFTGFEGFGDSGSFFDDEDGGM